MKKLFLAIVLLALSSMAFSQQANKQKIQELYEKIKTAGIRHPDFVIAQSIQETGWLKCRSCCLRYHNLFGFYIKGNKCKKFSSDEDCIAYYKSWQDKRYTKWKAKHPKQDYYHFLKYVKYATGDKYTRELKPKVAWVHKNLKL